MGCHGHQATLSDERRCVGISALASAIVHVARLCCWQCFSAMDGTFREVLKFTLNPVRSAVEFGLRSELELAYRETSPWCLFRSGIAASLRKHDSEFP